MIRTVVSVGTKRLVEERMAFKREQEKRTLIIDNPLSFAILLLVLYSV